MNEIIKVNTDTQTVSARDLHETLQIEKRFSAWFEQFKDIFTEGDDFTSVLTSTEVQNNGGVQIKELQDRIEMPFNNHENKSGCPCAECNDHNTRCHSTCDRYKLWKLKLDERRLEIKEDRKRRNDCCRALKKVKVH